MKSPLHPIMKNHHEIPKVYYLLVVAPSSAPTPSASSGIYERRRSRTTTSRAEGAEEETILDVFEALMLGISWGRRSFGNSAILWISGWDQWSFQDPIHGSTLVPYFRPYFVVIFTYIGLKNRPYIW